MRLTPQGNRIHLGGAVYDRLAYTDDIDCVVKAFRADCQ